MRKIKIHNPCNEYTRYYRYYNLFWDDLTEELKKRYEVEENRYFEFANSQRFEVHLQKQTCRDFLLLECEFVIEFEDTGDFYVLSVSDDLTHAILNEQDNPHLKKVLISQFNPLYLYPHIHSNKEKYSPWIYFPSQTDDLVQYYEKRKTYLQFEDKMYFRGSSIESRPILEHISRDILEGVRSIGGPSVYFPDLIKYKIGLSVGGRGEICYRDVEYMALGIPFIRFEYLSLFSPSLVPNVHYVSVERPSDLLLDRTGTSEHAKLIEKRFLEVRYQSDFLNYVASNAKTYYDTYLKRYNNVNHTLNLLGL